MYIRLKILTVAVLKQLLFQRRNTGSSFCFYNEVMNVWTSLLFLVDFCFLKLILSWTETGIVPLVR